MGVRRKINDVEFYGASVVFVYGNKPPRPGSYLVASLTNTKRVFYCSYRKDKGWTLKDGGRNIYAFAELPEFPPAGPQLHESK